MRALLSTIGTRGDVQPLVALASELRALGHDVSLCVPPDFVNWIWELGFAVTAVGPMLQKMPAAGAAGGSTLSAEQRRQLAHASVAAQFEAVAGAAEGCAVIVAATALQMAARSVAEWRQIPYLFVAYCPIVLPSPRHAPPPLPPIPGQPPAQPAADNRELWARDADRFNQLFGPSLNAHRASLGLASVHDVRQHVFTDRPWLAADPALAPWPDPSDGAVFQSGAWILEDDRPLPQEVEAFLDAGEPPVYFGFGSMRRPQDTSRTLVACARDAGLRAIVSRGWAELSIVDSRPDCLGVDEINQQALFKRVAVVVHHGGAGTTTTAAMCGAPQVIIPQLYDQHYWARRVEELGIGIAHPPGTITGESLTRALQAALQRDVAPRAHSVASVIRRDGARMAAAAVIDSARG
jgi:vancomycin aglycone glucosyltransferase